MRYYCYECGKSVTSELPDDSVIRAVLVCPECIEAEKVSFAPKIPYTQFDKPTDEWLGFKRKK